MSQGGYSILGDAEIQRFVQEVLQNLLHWAVFAR